MIVEKVPSTFMMWDYTFHLSKNGKLGHRYLCFKIDETVKDGVVNSFYNSCFWYVEELSTIIKVQSFKGRASSSLDCASGDTATCRDSLVCSGNLVCNSDAMFHLLDLFRSLKG